MFWFVCGMMEVSKVFGVRRAMDLEYNSSMSGPFYGDVEVS